MAGRFVTQKLSSWMCRSTSLLGDHASASVRAGAPLTRASSGGIRIITGNSLGAAAYPSTTFPNNRGIHGFAAAKYVLFPCSRTAAETSSLTTGVPSNIINLTKPAFPNSIRGAKRSFSSNATAGREISGGSDKAASQAEWDAAAWQARRDAKAAAWEARMASMKSNIMKQNAAVERTEMCILGFVCVSCGLCIVSELSGESGSRSSRSSSGCSSGQCHCSKS